jgi:hypothetical protein
MRLTVHYPLFWLLERSKGIGVLHASAVEKNGQTLIFTGLNGSGKSTLAAYFWQRLGYKLLSDNFLLYDSQILYGFPEVVRTPEKLINSEDIIYTLSTPVFKKYQAVLSPGLISMKAKPDAVFFTTIMDPHLDMCFSRCIFHTYNISTVCLYDVFCYIICIIVTYVESQILYWFNTPMLFIGNPDPWF